MSYNVKNKSWVIARPTHLSEPEIRKVHTKIDQNINSTVTEKFKKELAFKLSNPSIKRSFSDTKVSSLISKANKAKEKAAETWNNNMQKVRSSEERKPSTYSKNHYKNFQELCDNIQTEIDSRFGLPPSEELLEKIPLLEKESSEVLWEACRNQTLNANLFKEIITKTFETGASIDYNYNSEEAIQKIAALCQDISFSDDFHNAISYYVGINKHPGDIELLDTAEEIQNKNLRESAQTHWVKTTILGVGEEDLGEILKSANEKRNKALNVLEKNPSLSLPIKKMILNTMLLDLKRIRTGKIEQKTSEISISLLNTGDHIRHKGKLYEVKEISQTKVLLFDSKGNSRKMHFKEEDPILRVTVNDYNRKRVHDDPQQIQEKTIEQLNTCKNHADALGMHKLSSEIKNTLKLLTSPK